MHPLYFHDTNFRGQVPAAFLRASEVLEVMAESSGPVLVSEDNVVRDFLLDF